MQGKAGIDQCQVHGMADQIIDEESVARHAESFACELSEFVRLEVVGEERAGDEIKRTIGEWKMKSVADDGVRERGKMRGVRIEERYLRSGRNAINGSADDVARTGSDVKDGTSRQTGLEQRPAQDGFRGGDSAEPAVDAPQVLKRVGNLPRSAGVGVEKLVYHDATHERDYSLQRGKAIGEESKEQNGIRKRGGD